jgi:hypothetical protein
VRPCRFLVLARDVDVLVTCFVRDGNRERKRLDGAGLRSRYEPPSRDEEREQNREREGKTLHRVVFHRVEDGARENERARDHRAAGRAGLVHVAGSRAVPAPQP